MVAPHNYGQNTEKNLKTLKSILGHYSKLSKEYGFESLTMLEYGRLIAQNHICLIKKVKQKSLGTERKLSI